MIHKQIAKQKSQANENFQKKIAAYMHIAPTNNINNNNSNNNKNQANSMEQTEEEKNRTPVLHSHLHTHALE